MKRTGHPTRSDAARKPATAAERTATAAALKQFMELVSLDVDLERVRQLQLKNKGLTSIPATVDSLMREVRKMDLSGNNLVDISPLASLAHLSNLCLSSNPNLGSLRGLGSRLVVLTVANCGLTSLAGLEESRLTLRTLIANDNNIRLMSPSTQKGASSSALVLEAVANYNALATLELCETVVLTRNAALCDLYKGEDVTEEAAAVETLVKGGETSELKQARAARHPLFVFEKMSHLKKLSLSECGVRSLPVHWFLPMATEVRLARNHLTSLQPEGVIMRSLKILDISHNDIDAIATLRRCRFLRQISLRGNPLLSTYEGRDKEEERTDAVAVPVSLQRSLSRLLPSLESIDGHVILPSDQRTMKRCRTAANGGDAEEGDENQTVETATSLESKPQTSTATTSAACSRAVIAAEAEEKDVVLEVADVVARQVHAPIIRRERVLPISTKKGISSSGGDAVAKLRQQKSQHSAW